MLFDGMMLGFRDSTHTCTMMGILTFLRSKSLANESQAVAVLESAK